jgi:hypothetical protein
MANLPSGTSELVWANQSFATVGASAVQLAYRAQTTVGGVACDTGPVSFALTPPPALA